jgi:hypothetical protein
MDINVVNIILIGIDLPPKKESSFNIRLEADEVAPFFVPTAELVLWVFVS